MHTDTAFVSQIRRGSHADLTADYAAIPTEMKAVASYFGKEVLLGLTIEDILSHAQELREKLGDRAVLRALHFLCEDVRVEEEIDALKAGISMHSCRR